MKAEEIFQNKYLQVIFAVTAAFLWGSAFPSIKLGFDLFGIHTDQTFHKVLFAGYRFFIAGLLIFLFAVAARQELKITAKQLKDVFWLGILMTTIQYSIFYIGLSNTTAVKGAVLNSTSIFFTFVLAHVFLRDDRINKRKIFGVVMGFLGIVIVNYSPDLLSFDFKLSGEGLLLVAQVSGAVGSIYLKRISESISVVVFTAYQMMAGSLILIISTGWKIGFWPFHPDIQAFALLGYLSILSAVAFSLWNSLIKYNLVGQITIFKFLIPIFGVILSNLLIKEQITGITLLALLIVSLGIFAVNTFDYLTTSRK